MRNSKVLVATVAIGLLLYIGIMFYVIEKSERCDEHVILNDKTEYDCRCVSSFSNGMSSIKFCDGTDMTVPTHRIIQVTQIKK